MRKSILAVTAVLLSGGAFAAWALDLAQDAAIVHVNSADAKYRDIIPGASKAALWGDDAKGPYGSFTKLAPGMKNPVHTHTSDVHLVVIKGAYLYGATDKEEKRAGPGEYVFIKGGTPHWSGSDAKEGALFYEESPGKFDLVPVESK